MVLRPIAARMPIVVKSGRQNGDSKRSASERLRGAER